MLVVAAEAPDAVARAVEDFEDDRVRLRRLQIEVDDGAVGRVLPRGLLGRKRRVRVDVALDAISGLRREEEGVRGSDARVNLPERRDVVENPEEIGRASCRG